MSASRSQVAGHKICDLDWLVTLFHSRYHLLQHDSSSCCNRFFLGGGSSDRQVLPSMIVFVSGSAALQDSWIINRISRYIVDIALYDLYIKNSFLLLLIFKIVIWIRWHQRQWHTTLDSKERQLQCLLQLVRNDHWTWDTIKLWGSE